MERVRELRRRTLLSPSRLRISEREEPKEKAGCRASRSSASKCIRVQGIRCDRSLKRRKEDRSGWEGEADWWVSKRGEGSLQTPFPGERPTTNKQRFSPNPSPHAKENRVGPKEGEDLPLFRKGDSALGRRFGGASATAKRRADGKGSG